MQAETHSFRLTACRELMESHPGSLRIEQQVKTIEASYPEDPGTMLVFCRSIIETTCKTILSDRSIEIGTDPKFSDLLTRTRQVLGLEKPRQGDVDEVTRKNLGMITGGIGQMVEGLGNLRNSDGSFAHGADAYAPLLENEYAEILARAADAVVGFLFKSHIAIAKGQPHARIRFGEFREFDDKVDLEFGDFVVFEAPLRASEALFHCDPQEYRTKLNLHIQEERDETEKRNIISGIVAALVRSKS